jgi:hypothetical protein
MPLNTGMAKLQMGILLFVKLRTLVSIFLVIASTAANSQSPSPALKTTTMVKWEYKIIRIDAKGGGYSRVGSQYSSVGTEATSALPTSEELNALGANGWELVGTYLELETSFPNFARGNTVEGLKSNVRPQDAVLIFKREFQADRSRREAEEQAKLAAEMAAAQKKAKEIAADTSKTTLVDLDLIDEMNEISAAQAKDEKRLTDALKAVPDFKLVAVNVDSASTPSKSSVFGVVVLDGTDALLKEGNKYRKKSALLFAEKFADVAYEKAELKASGFGTKKTDAYLGQVQIQVKVVIQFGGKVYNVAEYRAGGNW